MKTINTIKNFAMRFVAIMAVVLLAGNAWGTPVTLFQETFGNTGTSNTSYSSTESYSATSSMFTSGTAATNYTGDGQVSRGNLTGNGASNGYTGASGESGCYQSGTANTTKTIIQIANIKITGYSNLNLSFGVIGGSTTHKINVYYKIDDGEKTSLISNGSATNAGWNLLDENISGTGDNLTLYFEHKPTNAWLIRLDDILVTGEVAGYAVSYNNGGHGTAPSGATASSVTLAAITGVTGYTCTGWTANKAVKEGNTTRAAGYALSNNTTYTILEATTFTAQWRANAYAVEFNANGGSGSAMSNQAFTYDEAAKALSANTYTAPTDKYFYGWHRTKAQADLGNREYADKAEVQNLSSTDGATVTLYAAWKDYNYTNYRTTCVNKFYVTYVAPDKTGGNVPVDETEYSKNATVTVLGGGTLEKTHYAFVGWTDGDNDYVKDDEFTITKDVELTARWTCDEAVTVAKAASTAHGSFVLSTTGELATCDDDVVVNVTSISPATGYEFGAITIDGVGTKDDNAKTVTYDQYASGTSTINVTFAPKTITVTWDANEGSVTPASSEYIYDGDAITLPTPEKTGYVFDGWFTLAEGGDEITEIGTTNKPAANVTYHAHWHRANYAIKWSVAGDDKYSAGVTEENNNADYEGTVSAPTAPADGLLSACQTEGKFVGWTASDAVYSNHPITSASDITALGIFTTTSTAVTGPTTFRAVYAEETTPATPNYLLQEEFDNTSTSDASSEISSSTFSNFNGTPSKAYKSRYGGIKLGSSGNAGYINSKSLNLSSEFYVQLDARKFGTDNANIQITVGGSTQTINSNELSGDEFRTFTKKFSAATASSTVKIGTNSNRAYIDDVKIYTLTPAVYTNYMTECCPQRTITIVDLDAAVGTISADVSSVCEGEQVTLSKTENHYDFTGWKVYKSDDATTTVAVDANNQFDMPDYNVTVEATWTPKNYEAIITAPNPAEGSVLAEGGSIEAGHRYVAYGSTLTVTATAADDDHYFQYWTVSPAIDGLNTSNNPMAITMPGNNITVTANFGEVAYPALTLGTSDKYTLTAKLANGDDIPNMGEIRSGTALMVTYELKNQNEFDGWKMNDGAFTTFDTEGNVATFNMPDVDLNIDIDVLAYYTLNLSAEHGTISAVKKIVNEVAYDVASPYHVHEGEKIEVTAEPESIDYKFKQWNKTGNTTAYDGSSATAKLTVGTANITLEAVFEDKVNYDLTLVTCGKTQEVISALEGTPVYSLVSGKTAAALTGYTFAGWSETEDGAVISDDALKLNGPMSVYAVYRSNACYQKVTSISAGQYLIVYEDEELAFNGSLTTLDNEDNTIAVEIGSNKILVTDETTAAEFTITATENGYSIKSASDYYIGQTSNSNGLASSTSVVYDNTIGFSNGDADIVSGGAYMRYNSASNQQRFRYYKSSTYTSQDAIQLYKRFAQGSEDSNPSTVVANGEELVINVATTLNNLTVEAGGKVSGEGNLTVNNLTIETKLGTISGEDSNAAGSCGQITGNGNLTANGDVFIEIELTQESQASYGWYAFSVPFQVDALNGVYYQDTKLTNEVGYAIMKYHEDVRAEGKYAWKKYRDIMQPGELYIITVADTDYKTLRFKKKAGAPIVSNGKAPVSKTTCSGEGTTYDEGWNGIGNPNLQVSHNTYGTVMQFLDHEANAFKTRATENVNLVVGSAFFIQYAGSDDELAIPTGAQSGENTILLAPARQPKEIENVIHEVKLINAATDKEEDNVFFTAREEATNSYQAGRDVAKMSMGTANCAQMMIPAYGTNLCAADFQLVNNHVEYPLTITTPTAGNYRIETAEQYADATVYLTQNGSIIWNLSMSGYEVELQKGTNNEYGLKIVATQNTTTDVETIDNSQFTIHNCQKVIIDEHVYILRGEQMFDVTGKIVK